MKIIISLIGLLAAQSLFAADFLYVDAARKSAFTSPDTYSIEFDSSMSEEETNRSCATKLIEDMKSKMLVSSDKIDESNVVRSSENIYVGIVDYSQGETVLQMRIRVFSGYDYEQNAVVCNYQSYQDMGFNTTTGTAPFAVIQNRKFDAAIVARIFQIKL